MNDRASAKSLGDAPGIHRTAWWDWPHGRIGGVMQDFRTLGAEAFCARHGWAMLPRDSTGRAMPSPITQALLAAMKHSTEPMALSDPHLPDHPMIAANAAFAAMTGYPMDEIVGRNCRFLQGPGTDLKTARRIGESIREGHGCIEWIVNHRRNGQAFWNLLFLVPVRDRSGRLLHYFGNQLDITTGFPDWLGEVVFGRAHMSQAHEAEFHTLLLDILESGVDQPSRAVALERILAAARRLAELSTALEPGAAQGPVQVAFLG